MSKARESFSQQLDEFERIAVEKIKEHGHDVFINETVEAIREALPGTRGTPARKDTRFSAHRIIHRIILQFSRYDVDPTYTQSAGLYTASNIGALFYREYIEELVEGGSTSAAVEFLDKLYNACRMNAGADFLPFQAFLLQRGLTGAVATWWPGDMETAMSVDSDTASVRSSTFCEYPTEDEVIEDCIVVMGSVEQHSPEIETSSSSKKQLHEQLHTLLAREEIYRSLLAESSQEIEGWKMKLEKLEMRRIKDVERLAEKRTLTKDRNKELKEDIEIYKESLTNIYDENTALKEEMASLAREKSTLQSQITSWRHHYDHLGQETNRLKEVNFQLKESISELSTQVNELQIQEKANRQLLDEVEEERVEHEQRRCWLAVVNQLNRALRKENSRLKV